MKNLLNAAVADQVKTRLASINNKHKLQNDQTNGNRPTLRRSTADSPNPNGTGQQPDDDRPTLKRTDGSSSSSSLN